MALVQPYNTGTGVNHAAQEHKQMRKQVRAWLADTRSEKDSSTSKSTLYSKTSKQARTAEVGAGTKTSVSKFNIHTLWVYS